MSDSPTPQREAPATSRRVSPGWSALALVCVVLMVFGSRYISPHARPSHEPPEASRTWILAQIKARALFARGRLAAGPRESAAELAERARLASELRRVGESTTSPRTLREVALLQHGLGLETWQSSIARLPAISGSTSWLVAERELGMWQESLGSERLTPRETAALREQIGGLDLGWYRHLALESIYRNGGFLTEAHLEARAARQASAGLVRFQQIVEYVFFAGLTILLALATLYYRKRQHPEWEIPAWLKPRVLPQLERPKSAALYGVFLSYLATYAALQLLGPRLVQWLAPSHLDRTAWLGISLGLSLVWLLVPLLMLRHTGITLADLGFRTRSLPVDLLWGIGGYAVAAPLTQVAAIVSTWLFRGESTPLHPVVTALAGSQSPLAQALLFTQLAMLAPLTEETLFRGVLFRSLTGRLGIVGALVATSTLFAVLHPQLPLGFLGIFVLGTIFNTLYLLRGSLAPCIFAHALNNAAVFLQFALLGNS